MVDTLPTSVRYIKLGEKGGWWKAARDGNQVHAGWQEIGGDVLSFGTWDRIETAYKDAYPSGRTQDLNALRSLAEQPSQHIWITFEDDCMWWCTVKDGITVNPDSQSKDRGHFWLTCATGWSDHSLGRRHLTTSKLPGIVTRTAGFKATIGEPSASKAIRRIIGDETLPEVAIAKKAREAYQESVALLIKLLGPKDFELLVDLILSRSGWLRLEKRGGSRAAVDLEVENIATGEKAFVQVKCAATQAELNKSVESYEAAGQHYQRMIFACHSPDGTLTPPADKRVDVWAESKIANRVVKLGLGDWVEGRL